MSSKQKMTIAITSLCLVAIVAVVAVIAVFAANQQNFKSSINVTYIADEIDGTASAKYFGGKDDADLSGVSMTTDGQTVSEGNDVLTFKAGDPTSSDGELKPQSDIELEADNSFVVFEYKFTNTSKTKAYTAALTFNAETSSGKAENVIVYFYVKEDKSQLTPSSDFYSTIAVEGNKKSDASNFTGSVQVDAEGTSFAYVLVRIDNKASDATFKGDFSWALNTVKV